MQTHVNVELAVQTSTRPLAAVDGVALWVADLDAAESGEPALAILSDDERARARRFVFDAHRRRFIACRAWLRTRLGERLARDPAALRFVYGPVGKPALEGERLRFNLSHSGEHALLAVADGVEVGVDIERVRPLADMDALTLRVFSDGERAALAAVPADQRTAAFFAGWTRKEAYIKARGEGIALLGAIEVALTPGEPARLMGVRGLADEPQRWSLEALSPGPGLVAAVCLERL